MRLLILITMLLSTLYANHIAWQGDFDKAHQIALKEDKKIMVLLIKKDCVECIETIKTTFINQTYIDKVNKEFISVLITKDQRKSYPIEMLYTFQYPSLFFLDSKELFICKPMRGEITPNKFKNYLEQCR